MLYTTVPESRTRRWLPGSRSKCVCTHGPLFRPGKAGSCALRSASRRNKPQDQLNPNKNFVAVPLAGGPPGIGLLLKKMCGAGLRFPLLPASVQGGGPRRCGAGGTRDSAPGSRVPFPRRPPTPCMSPRGPLPELGSRYAQLPFPCPGQGQVRGRREPGQV